MKLWDILENEDQSVNHTLGSYSCTMMLANVAATVPCIHLSRQVEAIAVWHRTRTEARSTMQTTETAYVHHMDTQKMVLQQLQRVHPAHSYDV